MNDTEIMVIQTPPRVAGPEFRQHGHEILLPFLGRGWCMLLKVLAVQWLASLQQVLKDFGTACTPVDLGLCMWM